MKLRLAAWLTMLIMLFGGCSAIREAERNLFLMDTTISLRVFGDNADAALTEIAERLSVFDRDFSHVRDDGELYRINNRENQTGDITDEMSDILTTAKKYAEETRGAFDPTIAPAVKLWGIGTEDPRVPEEAELRALLPYIDYRKIDISGKSLTLPRGFSINLGAIAKGYASDDARRVLDKHGIGSAVLSLGGNVYARGARPDGTPWRVGVRDPEGTENDILGIIEAEDKYIISSGDYERYFERSGARYHHILDPKTAAPADNSLRAVVIVCDEGARGDAYSTALFVMGYDEALEFWREKRDFEAVFVLKDNRVVVTEGIAESFSQRNESGRYTYEAAKR